MSQCTYRCVVLPDPRGGVGAGGPDQHYVSMHLTGAWCSLTIAGMILVSMFVVSQCTYRCVVLPDTRSSSHETWGFAVSMHLQVRGAP